MEFHRRGFLKTVTSGLALGCVNGVRVFAQTSASDVTGELEAGSGTLYLEGKLKSGVLKLKSQDFLDREDRSVVVRGTLHSTELYSAMFSYQQDSTVFALFHDSSHSTTLVLSGSNESGVGRVAIWNDNDIPKIYDFEKSKIMEIENLKDIRDLNGKIPDLVGKRKPPAFTWQELEHVFGSDPALQQFMRGRKSIHHPSEENRLSEWACRFLSMVPGSMLSLFWLAIPSTGKPMSRSSS